MISRETIDEVKNRIDIVDVISDFVSLKRSGQNFRGLSPFNNEKTPSFYVVPSKGIFKDFSSGKGGDAITFVMEHEGMSYLEAIKFLGKKYGVEIREEQRTDAEQATQSVRDSLYIVMNYAKDYFSNLLFNHEEGNSIGLSYFRERGFNDRTINKFELGYSLREWESLYRTAISAGYSLETLEKAGLIVNKGEGKCYDRFRGRVIFPVHNLSGKVIAFGARILTKEKDQPKYINSPETEIYHKSQVLYGMFQAKNAIRKEDFCYLVEGYTDVISMHQADVENVVASSGTALTEDQIRLMRRFTENVTVLFDGDAAGIRAALRGIDLVLKEGLNVRVVLLPDGEDPDSYSRKLGSTGFKEYLKNNTRDFVSFKIDLFAGEVAKDPIRRSEAVRELINTLALISDETKRFPYYKEVARSLEIPEQTLIGEINKVRIKSARDGQKKPEAEKTEREEVKDIFEGEDISPVTTPQYRIMAQERETIRLLLNYAESNYEDQRLIDFFLSELEEVEFTNPVLKEIFDAFRQNVDKGLVPDSFYFMENGSPEVKQIVADLTIPKYHASKYWSEKYHIFFPEEKDVIHDVAFSNVLRLKFRLIQKLMDENLQQLKQAKDDNEVDNYLTIHEQLKNAEKELAGILGIVINR